MRRLLPFAVAGGLVLLSACGSSGGSTAGRTSTSTTTRAASGDAAVARAALLRATDLAGFTAHAASDDTASAQAVQRTLPQCTDYVRLRADPKAKARSPQFRRGETRVDQQVDAYATNTAAAAQLDLRRDPGTLDCIRATWSALLARTASDQHLTVKDVSVSPIAVDDQGDGTAAYRITSEFDNGKATVTALTDFVVVQVGRGTTTLQMDATDAAGLAEQESRLLPLVTQRLRDALAGSSGVPR